MSKKHVTLEEEIIVLRTELKQLRREIAERDEYIADILDDVEDGSDEQSL